MSSRISDSRPFQWHDLKHEAWMNNRQQQRKQEQAGPSQRQKQMSFMDELATNCSSCIVNRRTICKSLCDAELVLIYRPFVALWWTNQPLAVFRWWRWSRWCNWWGKSFGLESFCATVMPTETRKMKNENLQITRWAGFFQYCAKMIFCSRGPANDHGNASASERNTGFVKPQTRIFFFFLD